MKMLNKIIGGSIAIAAVLAFSASTTQAQNLLVNPGFDLSAPGIYTGYYTPNPIYTSDSLAHIGTANSSSNHYSGVGQGWATFGSSQSDMASSPDSPISSPYAMLVHQAAGQAWAAGGGYQIVTITPGQQYTYSMFALTDTGIASTYANPVDLQLVFLNSSGTTNGFTTALGNWASPGFSFTLTANDTWQQFSATVTAPTDAAYAEVYAMFMQNGNQTYAQNVYFDNGSLVATPEPVSLALVGMGLASFYLIRRRKS
jgi:PEP-CTERM motif